MYQRSAIQIRTLTPATPTRWRGRRILANRHREEIDRLNPAGRIRAKLGYRVRARGPPQRLGGHRQRAIRWTLGSGPHGPLALGRWVRRAYRRCIRNVFVLDTACKQNDDNFPGRGVIFLDQRGVIMERPPSISSAPVDQLMIREDAALWPVVGQVRASKRATVVWVHTAPPRSAGTPRSVSAAARPCMVLTPASLSAVTSNISRCAARSAPSRRTRVAAAASGPATGRYPRSPPSTAPRALAAASAARVRSLINSRSFCIRVVGRFVLGLPASRIVRGNPGEISAKLFLVRLIASRRLGNGLVEIQKRRHPHGL